ncbi:hypothetical protein [Rugosimonospora africana]|uniref:Uncharacterized protein n=1 Tax=Rugosimonospora africana TaxID=556532 RepID=A0A8J3QV68_9ACTN|nr:hypothetical protein [Rugosimonospora africana]GIH17433.1 hypothetical protein Raf01_56050 [Rugosimonospora africana]
MLTEDDLRTRLHALADPVQAAPDPVPEVRRRMRVLRRRRTATTVALAVVVVLALGFAAGYGPLKPHHRASVPGHGVAPTPSALPPAKAPDLAHLRPAQQVWPGQVRLLQDRLPDGRDYTVCGSLGDGRYLIAVRAEKDRYGDIAVLDTRHGDTLTVLSVASAGQGTIRYLPQEANATKDGVAWMAYAAGTDHQWTTEIWASTLTAHSAKLVATVPGDQSVTPGMVSVVGDRVIFEETGGGIGYGAMLAGGPGLMYSVPRTGGQPQLIDSSIGHHAVTGAWGSNEPPTDSPDAGTAPSSNFELLNVLTGARIAARPNPATKLTAMDGSSENTMSCTPDWCLGEASHAQGLVSGMAVQHPDGSGYVETSWARPTSVFGGGRFVIGMQDLPNDRVQDFVWDVVTGAAGTFGPPGPSNGHSLRMVFDPAQNTFAWPGSGGKLVLDTTAFG